VIVYYVKKYLDKGDATCEDASPLVHIRALFRTKHIATLFASINVGLGIVIPLPDENIFVLSCSDSSPHSVFLIISRRYDIHIVDIDY